MKMYLNEIGQYVFEDSCGGIAVAKMSRIVESRVLELHRRFRLNIDGRCIEGHTRLDPHGRRAYEWECVGTSASTTDMIETIAPIVGDWKKEPIQRRRPVVTPVSKSWWMSVATIARRWLS